ncbi:hypothetical protein WOLCODRAFT_147473 [Wolfiporia cocos MD-104 SS10]|uniref:Aprataxin and PNK-like factor PBZ domain-containing protein n=1 Tax=Wolfiporia cocos (strain MD-104) TaxID=742152 RepID=A0A2H3IUI1_WOLCO|nr:hypothetical protein WOLCODRAFT_147473 [Wolfiporia cocos MD-104 SS10]
MPRVRNPPECYKMQFTDLNQDLIDRILTSLSDFNSLASANAAGPPLAFPAALRLARKPFFREWFGRRIEEVNKIVPDAGPDEVHIVQQPIDRREAERLVKNGIVVRALEDVFSWRCKDRRSSSSRLSPEESMRFHRAMYCFWLFCGIYCIPAKGVSNSSGAEINHSEHHAQFLRSFSAEELLEIRRVADFCADLFGWVTDYCDLFNCPVDAERTAIFTAHCRCNTEMGPEAVLENYNRLNVMNWLSYERLLLGRIRARHCREAPDDRARPRVAARESDPERGLWRARHVCRAVSGLKLYGKTNWSLIRGELSLTKLRLHLPGHLPRNEYEGERLVSRVWEPDGYARMMEEIFDAQYAPPKQTEAQAHAPKAGPWNAEGLYCAACVKVLLWERLWVWRGARQLLEPNHIRDDCRRGWKCRKQEHYGHAEMLNHFCMPARKDGEDLGSRRAKRKRGARRED